MVIRRGPTVPAIRLLAIFLMAVPWFQPSAQDAVSVLQLNIEYRTARNSAVTTPEITKRVDQLEILARNATADEKYGEAHRYLYHAIALLSGRRWTPFWEQSAALRVGVDRVVLEPGHVITLTISQIFKPERPLRGRLTGLVAIGETVDQRYRTVQELARLDDDPGWFEPGRKVTVTVPELPDGEYQLAVSYLPGTEEPGEPRQTESIFKTIQVGIARGIYRRVERLGTDLARLRMSPGYEERVELESCIAEVEYTIGLLHRLNGGEVQIERNNPGRAVGQATELLAAISAGRHPLSSRRGDIHLAYRSAVDGALQPYRIFVPSDYHPDRKWPLAVALHGWGGDENSLFEGRQNGELKRVAEASGYIVACPKGRGPTSLYLGNAERDVLDVIRQVERDYAIDVDRIYLLGHSMGGYGAWSIAANHPEMFAAIAPVSGLGSILIQSKLKRLINVPWLVTHGVDDRTVPIEESRRMVTAGRRLGIEIRFDEVAGGDHFNVFGPALRGIFAWFDKQRRSRLK